MLSISLIFVKKKIAAKTSKKSLTDSFVRVNKFILVVRTFVESNVLYIEKALIRSCKIAESEVARDLYPYESRGSNGRRRLDWGINHGVRLMSIEVDDTYSIQHCAVTQRADKYTSHNSYNSSLFYLNCVNDIHVKKKSMIFLLLTC